MNALKSIHPRDLRSRLAAELPATLYAAKGGASGAQAAGNRSDGNELCSVPNLSQECPSCQTTRCSAW